MTRPEVKRESRDRRSADRGRARRSTVREERPARDEETENRALWGDAGGLVHLYPWLDDLLVRDPPLELHERVWALAAVVDPGEKWPLTDPLVGLLAGKELDAEPEEPIRPDRARVAVDSVAAERLLASFAAVLPGFERSTAGYLRENVVRRAVLLEPLGDGSVRALLEPAALDPALARLPYPLAPFRLPWSVLVVPEIRGA